MTVQDYYYIDADLVKMDDNFYDSEGLLGRVLAGKNPHWNGRQIG